MPGCRTGTRVGAGLAACLLVGALTGCEAPLTGTPVRGEAMFCAELHRGNDVMRQNYESAGKEWDEQLAAATKNLGEYTRLVRRLADVAPDEIGTDMRAVADEWGSVADTVQDAVSNPLGALAGGLVASAMNSASVAAVDAYAQSHCGLSLVGTVSLGGTTAS